jgi:hypothetical protein
VPWSAINSGGSSNTGAIAGGIAGGIVALVAVILFFLFRLRRSRRHEEPVIFYPDRIVRHADHIDHIDLEGMEVTPFSYTHTTGTFSRPTSHTFSSDGSMRQYRDSQVLLGGVGAGAATVTSGSHYAPTSSGGGSVPPGSSGYAHSSLGGPGFPVTWPHRPPSPKECHECDGLHRRGAGRLGLASAVEKGESVAIQHSDGGRVAELVPSSQVQEFPPSYDSIPVNS